MPLQPLDAPHHLLEGALAATVTTIGIVQMLRAVDADTHEPTVVAEEATPLVGEQRAVGLQAVVHMAPGGIAPLQPHRPLIETHRLQQRFTAMPGKEHFAVGLCLQVLLHKVLQHLVAHQRHIPRPHSRTVFAYPQSFPREGRPVESALLQVVAVAARQVARRPYGLRHHVERTGKR